MKPLLLALVFLISCCANASAQLLYDTFTDPDGTFLSSHTMNIGSGWTTPNGQTSWTISLNQALSSNSISNNIAYADAGSAEVIVTLDVAIPATDSYALGINGRLSDSTHFWELIVEKDGVGSTPYLAINEFSGSPTNRASVNLSSAPSGSITLTATLSGSSITLSISSTGQSCQYLTATFNQTSTKFGLYDFANLGYPPTRFDNFLVVTSVVATTTNHLLTLGAR